MTEETKNQTVVEPEEIWVDDINDLYEEEYTTEEIEEMESLLATSMIDIKEGEIIEGKIVNINQVGVAVDIGFKSEGMIGLDEFDDLDSIKRGDMISVFLEAVEGRRGELVLSKRKADFLKIWEEVRIIYDEQTIVQGKCLRRVKGGIVVDLMSIDAFLPGSQIDVYPVRDFDALIGETMEFKIVKLNEQRKNVVLSRKIILQKDLNERREATLKEIQVGDVKEAIVKNITDFGVFVDINGLDGLIYITDLSWGRVNHPSEICKLDEKINIQILDIDYDKTRVSAGLKQLTPHPWEGIEEKYPEGSTVQGKVVSITDYGAFVEIEKGIEGLIHISEMSWVQHVKHPSVYLHLGDIIDAVVLNIKKEEKKISLGLKQLEADPWEIIENKYPVGSKHTGVVRSLTQFGAFTELEDGIDGLIHISDLSWTKKIRHPKDVVRKGQEIEIIVLDINKDERRIALGYKQLEPDPWIEFEKILVEGYETKCKVIRKIDKGIIVELTNPVVEGFVPKSLSDNYATCNEGDEIDLIVETFNKEVRKVVLKSATLQVAPKVARKVDPDKLIVDADGRVHIPEPEAVEEKVEEKVEVKVEEPIIETKVETEAPVQEVAEEAVVEEKVEEVVEEKVEEVKEKKNPAKKTTKKAAKKEEAPVQEVAEEAKEEAKEEEAKEEKAE
ncbi:MAG: 30S ribosomal protein S1 [Candidatus Delongbacteria bacterium]|nr:30S ribosomal protein S1 [Candidatus Delongbacteria bacterium]